MADLAASDVTVTVVKSGIGLDRNHRNLCKIAFGDEILTYPAGGVPLPDGCEFGMPSDLLLFLAPIDMDDGTGIVWKYDYENVKIRGYIQGVTVAAAGAVTMDDFPLDTTAEPMATAVSVSMTNDTGAGVKYLGKLVELAAGVAAPPASVLYVEAVGY